MDLSVIIPVYNEASSIRPLYEELNRVLPELFGLNYEIIFINDGSEDATASQVAGVMKNDSRVYLISFTRHFGLSAGLAAGFEFAKGEVFVSMDGDLQHDPQDIPRLLHELHKGYDLVCGNRKMPRYTSFTRNLCSLSANYIGRIFFGVPIHDLSTTFRAYRSATLKSLLIFNGAHRFIPVLAWMNNFKISEVVVSYRLRQHGYSKVRIIPRLFKVVYDAILIRISFFCVKSCRGIFFKKVQYDIQYKH